MAPSGKVTEGMGRIDACSANVLVSGDAPGLQAVVRLNPAPAALTLSSLIISRRFRCVERVSRVVMSFFLVLCGLRCYRRISECVSPHSNLDTGFTQTPGQSLSVLSCTWCVPRSYKASAMLRRLVIVGSWKHTPAEPRDYTLADSHRRTPGHMPDGKSESVTGQGEVSYLAAGRFCNRRDLAPS